MNELGLSEFTIDEFRLSQAMGVRRDVVQGARTKLKKGADWTIDRGRVVMTPQAARELFALLGFAWPRGKKGRGARRTEEMVLEEGEVQKRAQEAAGDVLARVMFPLPDVKKVRASMLSAGSDGAMMITVLVPDNHNFTQGMEITCRPVSNEALVYRLVGPVPRSPGKW